MGEDLDRGARQARAVDDAGVIQLVGDDEVVLAEDRRDRARVGREAALEDHAGLGLLERASLASSSMWISIVPAMVRTEPEPTPYFSWPRARLRAAWDASSGRGSCSTRG